MCTSGKSHVEALPSPGTGLRDQGGTLAENCKRDLEAMAGGAERDASWPELKGKRVEAARSGRMLFP